MDKEKIQEKAIAKIDVFLELANEDNPRQQELGWGPYVYYRFLHTEEYFEEIVTFADKEEAEAYLQMEIQKILDDPDHARNPWDDDEEGELGEDVSEYLRIKDWDLPIRRCEHRYNSTTIGLADAEDFVKTMPVSLAQDLFSSFFYYGLIPGYYEEH